MERERRRRRPVSRFRASASRCAMRRPRPWRRRGGSKAAKNQAGARAHLQPKPSGTAGCRGGKPPGRAGALARAWLSPGRTASTAFGPPGLRVGFASLRRPRPRGAGTPLSCASPAAPSTEREVPASPSRGRGAGWPPTSRPADRGRPGVGSRYACPTPSTRGSPQRLLRSSKRGACRLPRLRRLPLSA